MILRFGRDKEGAVVFAHTAALAASLPVVSEGGVIKAFSQSKKEVAAARNETGFDEAAIRRIVRNELQGAGVETDGGS